MNTDSKVLRLVDLINRRNMGIFNSAFGRGLSGFLFMITMLLILNHSLLYSIAEGTPISPVSAKEFQMKAVSLEKFSLFIDWPKDSEVNEPGKPFVLVVLGDTPLVKEIHSVYIDGKLLIKEKKVVLKAISDKDGIPPCDLLFISRSAKYRLAKLIADYEKQPVLIVSDTEGFAERGVHINFIIRNRALRFEVNLKALENAGFSVGYHLSKAALRVIHPNEACNKKK